MSESIFFIHFVCLLICLSQEIIKSSLYFFIMVWEKKLETVIKFTFRIDVEYPFEIMVY